MSQTRNALLALAALAALAASSARAADQPAKRSEGRYFVELAEIMLRTSDFDVIYGHEDHLGPRAGDPAVPLVAELDAFNLESPAITIGLNRASGKSSFEFEMHDFDYRKQAIPPQSDFEREGFVVTSTLLPPGIQFRRQAQPGVDDVDLRDDDFVPNWGTIAGYRIRADFQRADFTYARNVYENERFRLRWTGGLRYGQLEQQVGHVLAFARETGATARVQVVPAPDPADPPSVVLIPLGETVPRQDFFFMIAKTSTRGLGPKLGVETRWFLDKKKSWSVEAKADLAYIPESTSVSYALNLVDGSAEALVCVVADMNNPSSLDIDISSNALPVMPGLPTTALNSCAYTSAFAATLNQGDFVEGTWLATGNVGFRWQANDYFSVGLDLWGMAWKNMLSNIGVIQTISESGTFEFIPGSIGNSDPQLQNSDAIIHAPRFSRRETFEFDGISLNLGFQF